jgi:hypothetical protein
MKHPNEETLNDYVDELLSETERLEVRRHLDGCPDCKCTVEELNRIVSAAGKLGEIEPTRDLLPGVRAAVNRPSRGWVRWAAAAAAIAVVALLAGLRLGSGGVTPSLATGEPTIDVLLADFQAAEAEYVRATEMLARGLEGRRDEIEPETLELLDANLELIDSAIAEVRLALDRDGVGVENTQMLSALYSKKLNILMRASRLSS